MSAARLEKQTTPSIASFVKIVIFWFVLLHLTTIVCNSAGVSPEYLPHAAAGGFAIHSLLAITSVMSRASFGGFLVVLLTCLIGGSGIFISRTITTGLDAADTRELVTNAATDFVGTLSGSNHTFRRMGPVEHLAEAAKLIFEEESTESLETAQRHLRAVTPGTPQYNGAQRLLEIAKSQADQLESSNNANGNAPTVQILRREQKDDTLVITLRNNGEKPVRNIAYQISYFEARTGQPLDEMRSRISNVLNPQETWTFEIPTSVAGTAHAAISLVDWDIDGGS